MNQKALTKADEVIKLLEHLRREVEETKGYLQKNDATTAIRNQSDSNDELRTLMQKWGEFAQAIVGN
ncbi:hypothetical protein KDA00_00525 [Candidatus Saccharibacteria bacterium]|nr:hypothetical protein [Candidatus Saccharibacteria bacterium]